MCGPDLIGHTPPEEKCNCCLGLIVPQACSVAAMENSLPWCNPDARHLWLSVLADKKLANAEQLVRNTRNGNDWVNLVLSFKDQSIYLHELANMFCFY